MVNSPVTTKGTGGRSRGTSRTPHFYRSFPGAVRGARFVRLCPRPKRESGTMAVGSELNYDVGAKAKAMASAIMGDGVRIRSASYSGDKEASAIYSGGDSIAPGATPSDSGVILSTGRATDFTRSDGDPNRAPNTSTDNNTNDNLADFNALAGTSTYDAAYLDIEFVPDGDTLSMQFVFASEEYPEYSSSVFNDAVGVWINGELVPMAVGSGAVSVGGVNQTDNSNLYRDNTGDAFNTEMDGLTVTMTLKIPVTPGEVNSIRIGIADVSDGAYDSNLLIAANSMQTATIAQDDQVTMPIGKSATLDVLANDIGQGTLTITEINGIPVQPGDQVALKSGQVITLNPDGTLGIAGDRDVEDVNFTYTAADSAGRTDTAFVTASQVPCFVAGTRIATPAGEIPVEKLRPGDLVHTLDEGAQPLRWIGMRQVEARGRLAPVRIKAGTFGPHRALCVSPQHRILLRDGIAELLFGEAEVLVKAKDLVDGRRVTQREGGMVTYVHLLFDRHQTVFSEGLSTESYCPGPATRAGFDPDVLREICTLFPEFDPITGQGYSPATRQSLKEFEVGVMLGGRRARRQDASAGS